MSMQAMQELRDMLCRELDEMVQKAQERGGEMSVGDLDTYHKLTGSIASIDKIMMLDEGQSYDDGMSRRGGMWEAKGGYSGGYSGTGDRSMRGQGGMSRAPYRGESYGRGSSYAGRGQHYVRGHYSRADGMEQLRGQLEDMMEDGRLDDRQRMAIKKAMETMDE